MSTETQDRQSFIDALGITYTAQFVPQSLSRNAKESAKSLNWKVSLSRGAASLTTDYMQGIGHVPGYQKARTGYDRRVLETAAETGRYSTNTTTHQPWNEKPLPAPQLADVLYSLITDAGAVHMTFEEWCADFGYDTDSRKAHKTYKQCSENGLKLSRILGGYDVLTQLETIFQDY